MRDDFKRYEKECSMKERIMFGFKEVKTREKNLFVGSNKSAAIKSVERDSLGRISKIVMDTNNPLAFDFESLNEVFEVANSK